jgi:hypothetical protein
MIPGFAWICAGESRWRMPPSGSPGISRGRRKFNVAATQRANP